MKKWDETSGALGLEDQFLNFGTSGQAAKNVDFIFIQKTSLDYSQTLQRV